MTKARATLVEVEAEFVAPLETLRRLVFGGKARLGDFIVVEKKQASERGGCVLIIRTAFYFLVYHKNGDSQDFLVLR